MGDRAPGSNKRTAERLSLLQGGESPRASRFLFSRMALAKSTRTAQFSLGGPVESRLHPIRKRQAGLCCGPLIPFLFGRFGPHVDPGGSRRIPLGGPAPLGFRFHVRNVLTKFSNVNDFDLNCRFM